MNYLYPEHIISSLVTPLMDSSKRSREFIVEISLDNSPVPVVRRLSVPSNFYVGHFIYCLVYAMGWDGYHLTELTQDGVLWRSTKEKAMNADSGMEYDEMFPGMKVRNSFRATVSQLFKKVGDECSLTYDLGDSWHHTVRLVEIRRYEDNLVLYAGVSVEIVSGEGACPPEDCGGTGGYAENLRIIRDPEDRLHDYERTINEVTGRYFER